MLTRQDLLQDRARKCRELAKTAVTAEGRTILVEIAERYEREAAIQLRVSERAEISEALA